MAILGVWTIEQDGFVSMFLYKISVDIRGRLVDIHPSSTQKLGEKNAF